MKLINGEIFNAREPLAKLLGEKFPIKVSYGLAKLAHKLNDQLKVIDDVRNGLIKTYGEEDPENEQNISVLQGSTNFPKFVEELEELMNQEVEVVFDKVKLPEKVDEKMLEIEPSVLMALEKFVEVE